MNLTISFDIPSKYMIENFCVIVSPAVGIFSERLTDTSSLHDFSLWFFCGNSLELKLMWKVSSEVSFSRPGLPFFSFFVFAPFAYYMLSFGFVFKTESCALCSEFLTGLCYICLQVTCWCFFNTFKFLLR